MRYKKYIYFLITFSLFISSLFSKMQEGSCSQEQRGAYLKDIDNITDKGRELLNLLPNPALLLGILEKRHPYNFLLECDSPHYILVKTSIPYVYLAGIPGTNELNEIIKILNNFEKTVLICSEQLYPFFKKNGFDFQRRVFLEFDGYELDLDVAVPSNFYIKPIDTLDIFSKCNWFEFIVSCYGSIEQFFKEGFGFVLINDNNEIVSESYAISIGSGLCEIGIFTRPDHRGRQLSKIILNHIINECKTRDLKPQFSCNLENTAAIKLAMHSGFKIKKHYSFLRKTNKSAFIEYF